MNVVTPTGHIGAVISPDERYRYLLWRIWNYANPKRLLVIGYNPSTADASKDDPTVIRCGSFARREGCGGFEIVNLYALRSSIPRAIRHAQRDGLDPIGPECNVFVSEALARCSLVVAAWGALANEKDRERVAAVRMRASGEGRALQCLGTTTGGHPRHPLYVKGDTLLVEWRP